MKPQRRAYLTGATQDDLAEVIGQTATTRLIEALGGTRVYVPRTIGVHHPIAHSIGLKAAALLAASHGTMWLDLPKPHLRRARALEAALSGEMLVKDVALSFDYTERMIYKMLAEHRAAEAADDAQPSLFDLK